LREGNECKPPKFGREKPSEWKRKGRGKKTGTRDISSEKSSDKTREKEGKKIEKNRKSRKGGILRAIWTVVL